jgi:hypothetical protein
MTSKYWVLLLLTFTTTVNPPTAVAQGRGWRWFQPCAAPTNVVLDVRLDTASVFRTTFPLCLLTNAPWNRQTLRFRFTPTTAIAWPEAFVWRGGAHVDATSSAGRPLSAEIHEQGTDTTGSSLGIVIKSTDSLRATDTIFKLAAHKASPTDRAVTELVPGLAVVTYPVGWQSRPVVVHTRPFDNRPPPTPWIAVEECPGEGCSLGAWAACSTLAATTEKRPGSPVAFTLHRGDRVTALTGDVHIDIPGVVIFRDTITYVPEPWARSQDTVRFGPADTLYLLNYIREGYLVWWFRGRADTGQVFWPSKTERTPRPEGRAEVIRTTAETWWVRVRNVEGKEGWVVPTMSTMAGGAPHYDDGPERCARE